MHKSTLLSTEPQSTKSSHQGDGVEAIRQRLYDLTGISLADSKRDMIRSRLNKRLRILGLDSLTEYLNVLNQPKEFPDEEEAFINCLTTNKTDFFRESHHFDFLRETIIPQLQDSGTRRLRIWSAGCSSGEEPYTLAMTIHEAIPNLNSWDVRILASDIDTGVLEAASKGIYDLDRVSPIPDPLVKKYFLRGTGHNSGKVAVKPELKKLITFKQVNFMEDSWPIHTQFDIIFCRNVIIYFDRTTQEKLLTRFGKLLTSNGHLILGHSENIHFMADRFKPLGQTIYHFREGGTGKSADLVKPTAIPRKVITKEEKIPEHSIILGEVKVTQGPAVLKTLLGSCVAACLFDPVTGIGGMNHFSLPGASDEGVNSRYGAHAMELLITNIMKMGGDRRRLRANVYGGGAVIPFSSDAMNIGKRNAEFIRTYLTGEGIPVDAETLGGNRGMFVKFRPDLGKAETKPLPEREATKIAKKEESFSTKLTTQAEEPHGIVELF
jgi:chemotaxis protein methyltransferase CheR